MTLKEKQTEIKNWFTTNFNCQNIKHRQALLRAARMIYSYQTISEQEKANTSHHNDVGFNKFDAGFGTRLALMKADDISVTTAKQARTMLSKYSKQLADIVLNDKKYLQPRQLDD